MDQPQSLAIFLDTNVMLHFRKIDEIDWCGLAETTSCDLVVTPFLLHELERQKTLNRSSKLRRRAGEQIDYLAGLLERQSPIRIRGNVCLAVMDHEPLIDFVSNRLVREVGDDQLIASALDYWSRTGRAVGIATGDRGLALKIRSRPIRFVRMPEELRLPSAAESDASETRRDRLELTELKNRRPKLALRFNNGATRILLSRPVVPMKKIASLDEVKARYRPLSLPRKWQQGPHAELLEPTGPTIDYAGYMADQYNSELGDFFKSYADYVSAHEHWQNQVGLTFKIDFLLQNEGRGPATNIDVHIIFPETLELVDVDDIPRRPVAPDLPDPTGTRIFNAPPFRLGPVFAIGPKPHRDGLPRFERGGHSLCYDAGTVKHACSLGCEPVAVQAREADDLRPFQLGVSITCNEADKVEEVLSVGFE